jgi:4-hydroxyphenylpyruvate dioxygenase-like putative hemolysin
MSDIPPSVRAFFPNAKVVYPKNHKQGPALDHINQIAIVVRDIDAAIEYYGAAFGWGPFHVVEVATDLPYGGAVSKVGLKLAFALLKHLDLEIELAQPLSGNSPYSEHLRNHGEGVLHLRIATENIEGALHHLEGLGIQSIFSAGHEGRTVSTHVDSHQRHGVKIKLIRTDAELTAIMNAPSYDWRIA